MIENCDVVFFETPLRRLFKPLPDITAYELALLLPYLNQQPLYERNLESLGTAIRHLEEI